MLRKVAARDDLTPEERAYVERRLSGPSPRELGREGDQALRARAATARRRRAYRDGRRALSRASARCVWKARVLRAAPRLVGPLVRARQLRIERALGLRKEHVR